MLCPLLGPQYKKHVNLFKQVQLNSRVKLLSETERAGIGELRAESLEKRCLWEKDLYCSLSLLEEGLLKDFVVRPIVIGQGVTVLN